MTSNLFYLALDNSIILEFKCCFNLEKKGSPRKLPSYFMIYLDVKYDNVVFCSILWQQFTCQTYEKTLYAFIFLVHFLA